MNLWHPIGLLISALIIYWSFQDDRLIRNNPDQFLLRHVRQEGSNFYFTMASALNRVARQHGLYLAEIIDPAARKEQFESLFLNLPDRERLLNMTRWEIRFRLIAFVVIGAVLAYDWVMSFLS